MGTLEALLSEQKSNGPSSPFTNYMDIDFHSAPCPGLSRVKNIRLFSYNELCSATDNFHSSNRLGQGGFGTVYKVM